MNLSLEGLPRDSNPRSATTRPCEFCRNVVAGAPNPNTILCTIDIEMISFLSLANERVCGKASKEHRGCVAYNHPCCSWNDGRLEPFPQTCTRVHNRRICNHDIGEPTRRPSARYMDSPLRRILRAGKFGTGSQVRRTRSQNERTAGALREVKRI